MESIFTYDPDPPKVYSPWSAPSAGPSLSLNHDGNAATREYIQVPQASVSSPVHLSETGVTRLEAEPQEGPTEYKLHLLLRPRRALSSVTTWPQASDCHQSVPRQLKSGFRPTDPAASSFAQTPSVQYRQTRLQQLTTQLLWRLQQSSPFHSCSTAGLVLPALPQATPKLGLPGKPATLLPGLEESQGALYEIGVSDDGTLVGLAKDEMEESLTNLKAMAASLGCVVEVLREVVVGHYQRCEPEMLSEDNGAARTKSENLWVAEALVRPDLGQTYLRSGTTSSIEADSTLFHESSGAVNTQSASPKSLPPKADQLKVSMIGATNAGKSSLLGTLTTSALDNGRGKSRLNLLKHRHEIASGITSSVAQELIGYRACGQPSIPDKPPPASGDVVNYASENVSSWNDIHASAARLIFMSDAPGLPRYSKSTIRTLISWKPHWVLLCVAADGGAGESECSTDRNDDQRDTAGNLGLTLLHLDICLKLGLPIILVVTKMDIAIKDRLRQTLAQLLSALKLAARKPALLMATDSPTVGQDDQRPDLQCVQPTDQAAVDDVMKTIREMQTNVVPIVLTSALTGQGIGTLHGLLRSIPALGENGASRLSAAATINENTSARPKIFQVDEVFAMLPSKVYSTSTGISQTDRGVVLCGYVSSAVICMGEILTLGPFLVHQDGQNIRTGRSIGRPSSSPNLCAFTAPVAHTYARSTPTGGVLTQERTQRAKTMVVWQSVRVVSIRNLRLPCRQLEAGQVGTIGIEPVRDIYSTGCDLRHARKGMVLALSRGEELVASRSFTANFRAKDFYTPDSPPLILGGHAILYINSIRATATVASVVLDSNEEKAGPSAARNCDIFAFESNEQAADRDEGIKIKFRFLRTVEWVRVEDKVFVVPNTLTSSPFTAGFNTAPIINGFVGEICDLHV